MLSRRSQSKKRCGLRTLSTPPGPILAALVILAGIDPTSSSAVELPPQVLVPAGSFTMGSASGNTDERPEHLITLDDYYIDKFEVTNASFKQFIDAGGYSNSVYWSSAGWNWRTTNNITTPLYWLTGENNSGPANPTFPVVGVTWYEAEAYANFLCQRLPTEAEWEKAARSADKRTYPWAGSLAGNRANYATSGDPYEPGLTPVGFYDGRVHPSPVFATLDSPGPYGAYDQAGNAWEWGRDWYSSTYYSTSPASNPQGPTTGTRRVLRGGARDNTTNDLRTFNRGDIPPTFRTATVGFRLAGPARLQGNVFGLTTLRPAESEPVLRPIPEGWVALLRNSAIVQDPDPLPKSASDGSFAFFSPHTCGDQLVMTLQNESVRVVVAGQTQPTACSPSPCVTVPVVQGSTHALQWNNADEVDAVTAFYVAGRNLKNYWRDRLSVETMSQITIKVKDTSKVIGQQGGANASPEQNMAFFNPGVAQYEHAVLHELAHLVVGQLIGGTVADGQGGVYLEAAGIDEALADYFTAAYTGDDVIRIPGTFGNRPLAPAVPYWYSYCESTPGSGEYFYVGDPYYGARLLGGALWSLRQSLTALGSSGDEVDRWIYDCVGQFVNSYPVSGRTFNAFKSTLRNHGLGLQHGSLINAVFAIRNISDSPVATCIERPDIRSVLRTVQPGLQRLELFFSKVKKAAYYRIYLRDFGTGLGIGLGTPIADGVLDTTFVYTDPDTSQIVAFLVAAVDSSGNEGPASGETPGLTGVIRDPVSFVPTIVHATPNPSRGSVHLTLPIATGRPVSASIHSITGRVIRRLRVQQHATTVTWDGLDEAGVKAPPGIYLVKVTGGMGPMTGRIAIVR